MKAYEEQVPNIVVSRLPIYLRELSFMAEEGIEVTSSKELAGRLGISSAQIRKDLSHFGEFGKQGTGYRIDFLRTKLQEILNVTHPWEIAVIGAGDLGRALVHYADFTATGFHITLIFDNNPEKIGQQISDLTILPADQLKREIQGRSMRVAIVAVPPAAAQSVADTLVEAGVNAILCYAPITLKVPESVRVQYMDPVAHLQHMTYYLE